MLRLEIQKLDVKELLNEVVVLVPELSNECPIYTHTTYIILAPTLLIFCQLPFFSSASASIKLQPKKGFCARTEYQGLPHPDG